MIDYSVAGDLANEVRAFAIVESNEDENPPLADGGQAFGLLQMHPATFKRFYGCYPARWPVEVNDTLTVAQIKACASYLWLHNWTTATPAIRDLIVEAWNLGETGVFVEGRRNPEYLRRWLDAYDLIMLGDILDNDL